MTKPFAVIAVDGGGVAACLRNAHGGDKRLVAFGRIRKVLGGVGCRGHVAQELWTELEFLADRKDGLDFRQRRKAQSRLTGAPVTPRGEGRVRRRPGRGAGL